MVHNEPPEVNIQDVSPTFSFGSFLFILAAAAGGAVVAAYFLPNWIPGLATSLTGTDPKAFWYLSRGSAFAAYFILWLSMIFGVGITNKLAAKWPGLPPAIDLHQYTSILGMFFGLFHGMILLGDHYMNFKIAQILLPFGTISYKPLTVGIGQTAFYLWLVITLSFYVRKKIGSRVWRTIHFVSFVTYLFALLHGIFSGTDTSSIWASTIYWVTGSMLAILIVYRIIHSKMAANTKKVHLQQIQRDQTIR